MLTAYAILDLQALVDGHLPFIQKLPYVGVIGWSNLDMAWSLIL
jgi:hypothetical protein